MVPRWTDSTDKHGVPRGDQIYALLHPTFVAELDDERPRSGRIMLFIGPPHSQTDREVEILVHEFPDTSEEARIFHAMPLGPKYRQYREEHRNG